MRPRTVATLAVAAGALVGLVWWRRRSRRSASEGSIQIGQSDGSLHTLGSADPHADELESLALRVRSALAGQC